ncbi:hypothetical protein BC2230_40004 [Burkholderia cepacia]
MDVERGRQRVERYCAHYVDDDAGWRVTLRIHAFNRLTHRQDAPFVVPTVIKLTAGRR